MAQFDPKTEVKVKDDGSPNSGEQGIVETNNDQNKTCVVKLKSGEQKTFRYDQLESA